MKTDIFGRPASRRLADILESQAETDALLFENGGEITPELEEYMATDEKDLAAKVDGYSAVYREETARAAACDMEIKRLQALKRVHENAAKRVKDILKWNMQRFGVKSLNGNTCKAYFSTSEAVQADEARVLSVYSAALDELVSHWPPYVRASVELSRSALKAAIKAGEDIAGASVEKDHPLVLK